MCVYLEQIKEIIMYRICIESTMVVVLNISGRLMYRTVYSRAEGHQFEVVEIGV